MVQTKHSGKQLVESCFILYSLLIGSVLSVYLHPIETNIGLWTGEQYSINCFDKKTEHKSNGVIKWLNQNGEQIGNELGSPYTSESEDGVKLFFVDAKKSDSGQYKCVLEINDEVMSSASFNLHVYMSMERIGAKDMVHSAPEGETLSLNCLVRFDKSTTDSQITWMFNESKLLIDDSGKLGIEEMRSQSGDLLKIRNMLTIRNLSRTNEGNYTCVAATVNEHLSSIRYFPISVKMEFGPYFAADTSKYIWVSETENESTPITVSIVCKVIAYPPVKSFKWLTGDGLVMEAGKFRNKFNYTILENKSILSVKYANLSEIKSNFKAFNNVNMNKFRCHVVKQSIHNSTTFEIKIGRSPIAPIIANYWYDNRILKLQLNETENEPLIDRYHLIISNMIHIYFDASNKTVNNMYELVVDIPKGEHQMEIYAHNPIGWSQKPVGLTLAVDSKALIVKLDSMVALFVTASTIKFIILN